MTTDDALGRSRTLEELLIMLSDITPGLDSKVAVYLNESPNLISPGGGFRLGAIAGYAIKDFLLYAFEAPYSGTAFPDPTINPSD